MKAYPRKSPCGHHVHGPWPWFSRQKWLKIFKVSMKKNTKLWPSRYKSVYCKKMGLKSSRWSSLKACFKGYTFYFTTFLVRPSTGAQRGHERPPKNVQMTLKDQSSVNKFKVLFLCIPEDVWPSNFGKMLKNASEVTLVRTKNIFFPKNVEICAKFCGVQSEPGWRYINIWQIKNLAGLLYFLSIVRLTLRFNCCVMPQVVFWVCLAGTSAEVVIGSHSSWHGASADSSPLQDGWSSYPYWQQSRSLRSRPLRCRVVLERGSASACTYSPIRHPRQFCRPCSWRQQPATCPQSGTGTRTCSSCPRTQLSSWRISACLTQNKRSKNLQNWKESITLNPYSNSIYAYFA